MLVIDTFVYLSILVVFYAKHKDGCTLRIILSYIIFQKIFVKTDECDRWKRESGKI